MSRFFARDRTWKAKVLALLFSAGVQALVLYRLSHFLQRFRLCRRLMLPTLVYRFNQFFTHADIEPTAEIGESFLMPHPQGVVIGATAVIGNDVTIMHNVTLGMKHLGETGKCQPTVEDGVFIGVGAVLLGNIVIGARAVIAAGAIVVADVPPGTTVVGLHKRTGDEALQPNLVGDAGRTW